MNRWVEGRVGGRGREERRGDEQRDIGEGGGKENGEKVLGAGEQQRR